MRCGVQERRVLMVAQERDTVSAAVHAAAALLHPLRWQHIYLPLLPLALKASTCALPPLAHTNSMPAVQPCNSVCSPAYIGCYSFRTRTLLDLLHV